MSIKAHFAQRSLLPLLLLALLIIPLARGAATFTPSNDVVAIHSNGQYNVYDAASSSNTARGQALLNSLYQISPITLIVPFTANGASTSSTSLNVITTGGSPTLWLCGAAEGEYTGSGLTTSYSVDVHNQPGNSGSLITSAIGHQSGNGCSASDSGGGYFAGVAIGIANGTSPYLIQTSQQGGLTISPPSNSFAVVIVTCGLNGNYGIGICDYNSVYNTNIILSSDLSSACVRQQLQDYGGVNPQTAALWTCNSLSTTGSYAVTIQDDHEGGYAGASEAIAAYLFPNVTSTAQTGDKIYLEAETYNVSNMPLGIQMGGLFGTANNVALYGAGKYATKIQGFQNNNFQPAIGSTVSDLSVYDMDYQALSGSTVTKYGNDTVRNVYWSGYIDAIYLQATPTYGNVVLYNDTLTSGYDTINLGISAGSPYVNIFDSYIHPILNDSGGQNPSLIVRGAAVGSGTLNLVNTIINVSSGGNPCGTCIGAGSYGGNVLIYGGSISTTYTSGGIDLYDSSGVIAINSITQYTTSFGVISNTLGTYGPYSYQASPMQIPIVLSSNSFTVSNPTADLGQMETLSAVWNGVDSPYSVDYLIYNTIGLCDSQLNTGLPGPANSFTYNTQTSGCGSGTMTANLIITDNSIAQVTNSLTFTMSPAFSSPTWTALNNPQTESGNQILTAMILNTSTQPDVLVQHSNGVLVGYNASANTNVSRGIALLNAISNSVTGDNIYLKTETYNVISNVIDLSSKNKVSLYGAGKYQTIITSSYSNGPVFIIIKPASNSITTDLSIIGQLTSGFEGGWGNDNNYNAILRNVYIKAYSDGIYAPPRNTIVENVTVLTNWDAYQAGNGNVTIFDSSFITNGISTDGRAIVANGGTTKIVNSLLVGNTIDIGGHGIGAFVAQVGGSIYLYGDTVSSYAPSGTANDLTNGGIEGGQAGYLAVNSTTVYNALRTTGSITSLGSAPYGPYSYQKYPTTPPGNWIVYQGTSPYNYNIRVWNQSGVLVFSSNSPYTSATSNSVNFVQQAGWRPGIFTANIYVTDSATANVIASNSLTYKVGITSATLTSTPTLPALLDLGQSITFNALVYNGVGPYTYNFFIVNTATNAIFASQSSTNSLTTNSFVWNVPSSAAPGTYEANVVVTDSEPVTVNSVYISTITVNPLLSSVRWTSLNNPQAGGGSQTLMANVPINYSNQPDVLVRHSNGGRVGYNALANTDQARGQALLNAFTTANLISGDSIYLKAGTYNVIDNTIYLGGSSNTLNNVHLYGAGKYKTTIIGTMAHSVILPATNSVTSDMGIIATQAYAVPWGFDESYGPSRAIDNATLSNVYINGTTDGVLFFTSQSATVNVINVTIFTNYDAFNLAGGLLYTNIYNANIISTYSASTPFVGVNRGIVLEFASTVNVFGSNIIAIGGTSTTEGAESSSVTSPSTLTIHNSIISTDSASGTIYDLIDSGSGVIQVSPDVTYNALKTSGSISPVANVPEILPSSYQPYPMTPPWYEGASPYSYNILVYNASGALVYNSLSPFTSATGNQITFTQQATWGKGTFTANVYVKDSATTNIIAFNSLAYGVGITSMTLTSTPTLPALLDLGQSITFNAAWTGGLANYNALYTIANSITNSIMAAYQFNGISGTTNSFVFIPTNDMLGNTIEANVLVTDSASETANSTYIKTLSLVSTTTTTVTTTTVTTTTVNTTTVATTTVPGGSGNPGGPGGPTGTGGSLKPTATLSGSCYTITNMTALKGTNVTLDGMFIEIVTNFIGPTSAGVTVNNVSYTLTQGALPLPFSISGINYTIGLTTVTYLPILHTIEVNVCGPPGSPAPQTNTTHRLLILNNSNSLSTIPITSNSATVNIGFWPGKVFLSLPQNASNTVYLHLSNATFSTPKPPRGYTKLVAINLTVNSTSIIGTSVVLVYDCAINRTRITTFILANGIWDPITPFTANSQSCTASFAVPPDPIIGLMARNQTVTTTTSIATTTTVAQSEPWQQTISGTDKYLIAGAIAAVVIIALLFEMRKIRKRKPTETYPWDSTLSEPLKGNPDNPQQDLIVPPTDSAPPKQ